jgi:hypothetical protein
MDSPLRNRKSSRNEIIGSEKSIQSGIQIKGKKRGEQSGCEGKRHGYGRGQLPWSHMTPIGEADTTTEYDRMIEYPLLRYEGTKFAGRVIIIIEWREFRSSVNVLNTLEERFAILIWIVTSALVYNLLSKTEPRYSIWMASVIITKTEASVSTPASRHILREKRNERLKSLPWPNEIDPCIPAIK